jgi:hypothetical protein
MRIDLQNSLISDESTEDSSPQREMEHADRRRFVMRLHCPHRRYEAGDERNAPFHRTSEWRHHARGLPQALLAMSCTRAHRINRPSSRTRGSPIATQFLQEHTFEIRWTAYIPLTSLVKRKFERSPPSKLGWAAGETGQPNENLRRLITENPEE